eukprot:607302-Prorocentrum_minimum.AAC.1
MPGLARRSDEPSAARRSGRRPQRGRWGRASSRNKKLKTPSVPQYLSPQIPTNFMHINSFSGKEYLRAQQAAWDVSEDVWNNSKCGPAGARQYDHRHSEGGFSLHCSHQARWIECGACSASALVF